MELGKEQRLLVMKAFLLAAGIGTRLRPLTYKIPKCLVPVNGRPLLDYWMELFRKHNVDEVLINTHYLYEDVRRYIFEYNKSGKGPVITESFEEELLGSSGTVKNNRAFVENEENFFICYADNLTNVDLTKFSDFHKSHSASFSMALFRTSVPKQCGIAELDEDSKIVEFVEKPENPKSNLANAGIYLADNSIFNYIPNGFSDFGKDIIPKLVGKIYGWEIKDYLLDIGTMEKYKKAQDDAEIFF